MDSQKTMQSEKGMAISNYVSKSILPIIAYLEDNGTGVRRAGSAGTGTLFKFIDKYFIVTAGHVLTAIKGFNGDVGIPIDKSTIDVPSIKECILYWPDKEDFLDKYDIGIIKLSNDMGKKLEKNYNLLSESNIKFTYNKNNSVFVSGYPSVLEKFDERSDLLSNYRFELQTRYKIPKDDYKEYDPKAHILVEYGSVYYLGGDERKPVKAIQELEGISGCSMWEIEDACSLWSAEKCIKVIGIQSRYMKEEYIKGTKWIYMIEAFKYVDEDVFRSLSEHKEKQLKYDKYL